MISPKLLFKILPWFLLLIIVFSLYLTNHWPFEKQQKNHQILMESTVILQEIEPLGKLELVKYNFKEVFEYKQLSDGKIVGNAILKSTDYNPDISVMLIATGEAVGCIDLSKLDLSNIDTNEDSVVVYLPAPELCYYKLDLDETKIYSFSRESWWSRMFSDDEERDKVLQIAYQEAESRLKEIAVESGIYNSTNENVKAMLQPLLEQLTGKNVKLITVLPALELEKEL